MLLSFSLASHPKCDRGRCAEVRKAKASAMAIASARCIVVADEDPSYLEETCGVESDDEEVIEIQDDPLDDDDMTPGACCGPKTLHTFGNRHKSMS